MEEGLHAAQREQTFTAIAFSGNRALATWCGPCNNTGFGRGAVVGTFANGSWTFKPVDLDGNGVPNRYLAGAAIDPKNANHLVLGVNGFSRRFTEGPGAGVGHIYESFDAGKTWKDTSGNLPDVPVNDVVVLPSGGMLASTDLGVVYRAPKQQGWSEAREQPADHGRARPARRSRRQPVRRHARPRNLAHPRPAAVASGAADRGRPPPGRQPDTVPACRDRFSRSTSVT